MIPHRHAASGKPLLVEYAGSVALTVPNELLTFAAMAVCSCGATRCVNFLGPHVEDDDWVEPEAGEEWFRDWHSRKARRSALVLRGMQLARSFAAAPKAKA